jgi:hypothetical protein
VIWHGVRPVVMFSNPKGLSPRHSCNAVIPAAVACRLGPYPRFHTLLHVALACQLLQTLLL